MLQPETPTVVKLFSNGIQFEIPVYQRAYVWTAEANWAPLWQDVVDTVARYAAAPDGGERLKHFLGPIVLHQRTHAVGGIERRTVIDGQQRLTTLQLLLAAVRRVAVEHDCTDVVDELTSILENRGRGADGAARQKIRPSRRDREQFLRALSTTDVDGHPDTGPLGAFAFFHRAVHDWLTDVEVPLPPDPAGRLTVLQDTIMDLLFVVAINLDDADNPQIIFETLNARGTALGALDLVKNALFAELEQRGNRAVELHDELWEPTFEAVSDEGYWSNDTEQGRRSRSRSSWFLMHWLAAELGTVVRADRLYETFRRDVLRAPGADAAELVRRLCRDAGIVRSFDDLPVTTVEGRFFARLRSLDTTTMHPVALLLFRSVVDGVIAEERRNLALSALESWLVRRSILRLTSQSYNRILATMLAAAKSDPSRPDRAAIDSLRANTARTSAGPTTTNSGGAWSRPRCMATSERHGCACCWRRPNSISGRRAVPRTSRCPGVCRWSTCSPVVGRELAAAGHRYRSRGTGRGAELPAAPARQPDSGHATAQRPPVERTVDRRRRRPEQATGAGRAQPAAA